MKSFIACMLAAVAFAAKNENAVNKAYCQVADDDGNITGQLVYMGKERWDETKCIVFFSELMPETEYAMVLHTGGTCEGLDVTGESVPFEEFTTDISGMATLAAREEPEVSEFIDKVITVSNKETMLIEACCVISTESIRD